MGWNVTLSPKSLSRKVHKQMSSEDKCEFVKCENNKVSHRAIIVDD